MEYNVLLKSIKELSTNIIFLATKKNITISTMESCTSGLLCSTLTNVEGASSVVKGGYITYSNEQKINCGVPKETIEKFGVYSYECSIDMAKACINQTKTTISIGVTGCLGNLDKNNPDGVIGKVYFSINMCGASISKGITLPKDVLMQDREYQKLYVINKILIKLFDIIIKYHTI